MEAGEESTTSKPSKTATTSQETPIHTTYLDWFVSMQAYYGGETPPFFTSTVASPTPHPYVWGGQHPMVSPYGNLIPYPSMYPPGGVYAHPNMAMAAKVAHGNSEPEGKSQEAKNKASVKKTKGNLGLGTSKAGENGKTTSGSGNEGPSQSAESGSDGSTDTSDENTNHDPSAGKKGSFIQMLADGANQQNNAVGGTTQSSIPGKPVALTPAINLNIGMNLWNGNPGAPVKLRPESGVTSMDKWIQDGRELKRQKRKQSNRESARRSRLRKQVECEELQRKVESLSNENRSLLQELKRLTEECNKLTSENNSIKEELTSKHGPEAISDLEDMNTTGDRLRGGQGDG